MYLSYIPSSQQNQLYKYLGSSRTYKTISDYLKKRITKIIKNLTDKIKPTTEKEVGLPRVFSSFKLSSLQIETISLSVGMKRETEKKKCKQKAIVTKEKRMT